MRPHGLALVSAEGFDNKAEEYLARAAADPKLVDAHERMANLALEDYELPRAGKEADAALTLSDDALDAMAIHAAVEILSDRSPEAWIQRVLKINPAYGQGYAIIASQLVINRRYDEGVAYYRKAIDLDPRLWSAAGDGDQSDAPRSGGRAATRAELATNANATPRS
jgi:tetratricopeptide (TPR) repeat protein